MESQKELNMEKYLKETDLNLKARFFALYWGQKVFKYHIKGSHINIEDISNILLVSKSKDINHIFLHLKPLSRISDEDALWTINNHHFKFENPILELSKLKALTKEIHISYIFNDATRHLILKPENLYPHNYDYLRSKGYALPYMDLSVEDLQNYGWIKLEE